MENTIDVAILGAGIAGLGAALKAKELGRDYAIFEAKNSAGGLLDNFTVGDYRFDNAVHLSFAKESMVREIFDRTPFHTHPADSLNFDNGKWLKHPVQNNLFPLPAEEKVELIQSFISRRDYENIPNYEAWLRHQYGDMLAERYPLKYTKKYWQCEASELSTLWIGNRMRRADIKEVLFGAFTSDTPNTYYTNEMRYPKRGGYKAFIQCLIDESNILLNHEVSVIDLKNRKITFLNGRTVAYSTLVSSLPLPILCDVCVNLPVEVRSAVLDLEATSIDLISVGLNCDIVKDLWFYIYDEDIFASRVYSPSVKSPENAPKGCSSLQFEIYNPGRVSQRTAEELKENVVYALGKMKIASQDDIEFLHHKFLPWGNVVFKSGMEESRDLVRRYFSNKNIATVGRFGEWDYLWSNQSLISGFNGLNCGVGGR